MFFNFLKKGNTMKFLMMMLSIFIEIFKNIKFVILIPIVLIVYVVVVVVALKFILNNFILLLGIFVGALLLLMGVLYLLSRLRPKKLPIKKSELFTFK